MTPKAIPIPVERKDILWSMNSIAVMMTTIMPAIIDKVPITARMPVSFLFNFAYCTFELTFKRLLSNRGSHIEIDNVTESLICNYCAKRQSVADRIVCARLC
jgi:hypothetical protein